MNYCGEAITFSLYEDTADIRHTHCRCPILLRKKSMATNKSSVTVVYVALASDVLVGLSKLGAFALSGSVAMLTESIHSAVDMANQIFLLVGQKRSETPADEAHPFGYGKEIYFWAFVVAIIILLSGGVASIYEGMLRIINPAPIESVGLALGVLALSAVFEGSALAFGYRQYKRVVRGRLVNGEKVTLWRFIKLSKDPNLYISLVEDSAALIGLGIAATGVCVSAFFHFAAADGIASVAIGLLLIGDSAICAIATRSLIAGEAVAPPVLLDIKDVLKQDPRVRSVVEIRTLHLGPDKILVAPTLELDPKLSAATVKETMDELSNNLKAKDERISYIFFRMR